MGRAHRDRHSGGATNAFWPNVFINMVSRAGKLFGAPEWQSLLTESQTTVFIVDDDAAVRSSLKALIESADLATEVFSEASVFLDRCDPKRPGCLVLDVRMPEMDGMRLQEELAARRCDMPVIFITGHADIPTAVRAVQRGAFDFIEKPFPAHVLLDRIRTAIERNRESRRRQAAADDVIASVSQLTPREREVLSLLVEGCRLKEVARRLHRSYKTVDCHKANLMKKLNVHDRVGLVRMAIRAGLVAA